MLFTSYPFIGFLLILFLLYYVIPKRFQWMLLLLGSYVFYSFAGVKYLFYIIVTTVSTYVCTRKINSIQQTQIAYLKDKKDQLSRDERKKYKADGKAKQRVWMIVCLLINFGILGVIKYYDFTARNINSLLDMMSLNTTLPMLGIALPLGISFYIFQTMGYVIDVYREKYAYERNIFKLALFISFFPQLIQGPISRFDDLKENLFGQHSWEWKRISYGFQRILWGFFKKLVIADRLFIAVGTIVKSPEEFQGFYVVLGMFFYAITLYADFTGGIDIAIGAAQVFGITLKENFERPFFSKSITEYWRRWHITLGTWFKDYMFFPISVSKPMLNLSKKARKVFGDAVGKRIPVYTATIVVWFTTGVWHGAAWNFIVWGMLNCLVILISQECTPLYQKFHEKFSVADKSWYRVFQMVRTFWLMSVLRTLDVYRDVPTTFRMYGTVLTKWNLRDVLNGGIFNLGLASSDYIILILSVVLLLYVSLQSRAGSYRDRLAKKPLVLQYGIFFALFLAVLIFGAYGTGYDSSSFIYSQF